MTTDERLRVMRALLVRCIDPVTELRDDLIERRGHYEGYESRTKRYDRLIETNNKLLGDINEALKP
jgi:hypothetical protein